MARIKRKAWAAAGDAGGLAQYVKLEDRLILLAWLNGLFGYKTNREMLADAKSPAEGYDSSGYSKICLYLKSRGEKVKLSEEELSRYDANIRSDLEAINRGRTEPVVLRYFQYLSVLYSEIFLDRYFNRRASFLAELNAFVRERNENRPLIEGHDSPYTESDLAKLAFWMATGSGKTLIMHINYHQFMRYNNETVENILLITPNEGLSEQHLAEMAASGIPAKRFDLKQSGLWAGGGGTVQVIEITKLTEEKRGGGLSVPVESFEGRNLIFVDEGHKGSGGEAWRNYRDTLGEKGFTFEYSATFGQALGATRNDPLTAEYGKAIVFDYSYRYFYGDGYGKDFRILNLKEDGDEQRTEMLLLGNLLSFYEQQLLFHKQAAAFRPYNIEKPLWVFVGSTVNAVYSENKQKRSDVLTVAHFLHHVLENKRGWVMKGIEKLLKSKSGIMTDGVDIFTGRFAYLNALKEDSGRIYADIMERIFHSHSAGGLHLCDIRGGEGELGMKAAGAEDYFGLIYIGDTAEFKKLAEADGAGIILGEDALTRPLFEGINNAESKTNILVGAKKFMEGWNSWRVSNMGLLNIGRKEGSQIIQLFGRGVRLRGMGRSLKRSAAMAGNHPDHARILETLNIFAVRANYMGQFRDYLEREGVETDNEIEMPLFVWANEQFLKKGLVVPRIEEDRKFSEVSRFLLEPDRSVKVTLDMSVKVQAMESDRRGVLATEGRAGAGRKIPEESSSLIDWEQTYLDLLEYKESRGMSNLLIRQKEMKQVITQELYTLIADEAVFNPGSFTDRVLLQNAATNIIRKYIDKYYRIKREKWESNNLIFQPLAENDPNIKFNSSREDRDAKGKYIVRIRQSERELIKEIDELRKNEEQLRKKETEELPRIYFDRHIYLPLLLDKSNVLSTIPQGLKDSEGKFVRDLRNYWMAEKDIALKGKEVYLLRNLSRGSGIGFFEDHGFYPDFILWLMEGNNQRLVFIEPHGMLYSNAYTNDEKARLHERLPELAIEISKRSGQDDISLDSFIVSATSYEELHVRYDDGTWNKEQFAEKHILFQEERERTYDYIDIILNKSIKLSKTE